MAFWPAPHTLLHTVGSARARRWAVYLGIVVVVVQGSSTIDRSFWEEEEEALLGLMRLVGRIDGCRLTWLDTFRGQHRGRVWWNDNIWIDDWYLERGFDR